MDAPTRSASPDGDLKKIGHAGMDAEHAAIGQALQELRETRSRDALQVARDEFREHATHEEELMVAARFGGSPDDDLSAVNSHRRDHERIVALADAVLNKGRRHHPQEGHRRLRQRDRAAHGELSMPCTSTPRTH